jgi:hypothetical protein
MYLRIICWVRDEPAVFGIIISIRQDYKSSYFLLKSNYRYAIKMGGLQSCMTETRMFSNVSLLFRRHVLSNLNVSLHVWDGGEDYIQFLSCLQGLSAMLVLNIDRF